MHFRVFVFLLVIFVSETDGGVGGALYDMCARLSSNYSYMISRGGDDRNK